MLLKLVGKHYPLKTVGALKKKKKKEREREREEEKKKKKKKKSVPFRESLLGSIRSFPGSLQFLAR